MRKWLRKIWRAAKKEIGQLAIATGVVASIYEFSDDFISSLAARRLIAISFFICCFAYYTSRICKAAKLEALGVFLNKKMSEWLRPFLARISHESDRDLLLQEIWKLYPQANKKTLAKEIQKIISNHRNSEDPIRLGAIVASAFWAQTVVDDLLAIIDSPTEPPAVVEQAVIALGEMKNNRAIPVFQTRYATAKDRLRQKMLEAAERIGQNEQDFYAQAARCKQSGATTRGEAMRCLAAEPVDLVHAVNCLCQILTDKTEPPEVRSDTAYYLGELQYDAEDELLGFCEESGIYAGYRQTAVLALKRKNLRDFHKVRERLTALLQHESNKDFRKTLAEVIRFFG